MGILLSPGSSRSCGFFARMFPISQGFPTLMYVHASVCSGGCRSSYCSRPHLNQNPTYALCFKPSWPPQKSFLCPFSLTFRAVVEKHQAGVMVWDKDAKISMTGLQQWEPGPTPGLWWLSCSTHQPPLPQPSRSQCGYWQHISPPSPRAEGPQEFPQCPSLQCQHTCRCPFLQALFPHSELPFAAHPTLLICPRVALPPISHTLNYPLSEETTDIQKINQRQRAS